MSVVRERKPPTHSRKPRFATLNRTHCEKISIPCTSTTANARTSGSFDPSARCNAPCPLSLRNRIARGASFSPSVPGEGKAYEENHAFALCKCRASVGVAWHGRSRPSNRSLGALLALHQRPLSSFTALSTSQARRSSIIARRSLWPHPLPKRSAGMRDVETRRLGPVLLVHRGWATGGMV